MQNVRVTRENDTGSLLGYVRIYAGQTTSNIPNKVSTLVTFYFRVLPFTASNISVFKISSMPLGLLRGVETQISSVPSIRRQDEAYSKKVQCPAWGLV